MKQIPLVDWPIGLCRDLTVISDGCAPRLKLRFEAFIEDGLGLQIVAIVETESGVFAVRRGVNQPQEGCVVVGMESEADIGEQLQGFLKEFDLNLDDVTWTPPEIEATP